MDAKYVAAGEAVDYRPASNVSAGDIVVQGDLVGVATTAITANTLGSLTVSGVFDVAKASATVFTAGAKVYWDATAKEAVTTSSNTYYVGKAIAAAGNGTTTVRVRFSQ